MKCHSFWARTHAAAVLRSAPLNGMLPLGSASDFVRVLQLASCTVSEMSRQQLLKTALTLVEEHGFTRHALSLSALSLPRPRKEPLSDTAVSALFGNGDDARMTLLNEWLAEGRRKMCESEKKDLNEILKHRLKWNDKVLGYLPEVRTRFLPSYGPYLLSWSRPLQWRCRLHFLSLH